MPDRCGLDRLWSRDALVAFSGGLRRNDAKCRSLLAGNSEGKIARKRASYTGHLTGGLVYE